MNTSDVSTQPSTIACPISDDSNGPSQISTSAPIPRQEVAEEETSQTLRWQKSLLPLMQGMIIALTAFFVVATLYQLKDVQDKISTADPPDMQSALKILDVQPDNSSERLAIAQWRTISVLEGYIVQRRYRQGAQLLMARMWVIYLGFVTGMILALVGASFILGKLRETSSSIAIDPSSDHGLPLKLSLQSASPGLVLAVLGTILMILTVVAHVRIDVTDSPIYLQPALADLEKSAEKHASQQGTPGKVRDPDEILKDVDKKLGHSSKR